MGFQEGASGLVTINSIELKQRTALLVLDNGEKLTVTKADLSESGFKVGDTVEKEVFSGFIRKCQYPGAINMAVRMLAGRACSTGEIMQKLRYHHYSEDVIDMVMLKLKKENLLDDRDFSDQWVRYRVGCKYGSRRIIQELKRKGVQDDTVYEAIGKLSYEQELDSASDIARKGWIKRKPGENAAKTRQRVISALIRKGYSWDISKRASDIAENECCSSAE